ncbi:hypothetical protein ANN_17541 [Periplaneta americana]|uniref:Uncharacterized protein n=1 Tax=Periplaneta americana TaxID=6978 RepID=A0ABQ8ST88_PERAM|nr:hypothetical protein ANN_17541 [Periplaneta americana]
MDHHSVVIAVANISTANAGAAVSVLALVLLLLLVMVLLLLLQALVLMVVIVKKFVALQSMMGKDRPACCWSHVHIPKQRWTIIQPEWRSKELAYKTLVRPIMEYGAVGWDPYRQNEIDSIEKVQRKAAKYVKMGKGHGEEIVKDLGPAQLNDDGDDDDDDDDDDDYDGSSDFISTHFLCDVLVKSLEERSSKHYTLGLAYLTRGQATFLAIIAASGYAVSLFLVHDEAEFLTLHALYPFQRKDELETELLRLKEDKTEASLGDISREPFQFVILHKNCSKVRSPSSILTLQRRVIACRSKNPGMCCRESAAASTRAMNSSPDSIRVSYTELFKCPNTRNSSGVRSGERAGHPIDPPRQSTAHRIYGSNATKSTCVSVNSTQPQLHSTDALSWCAAESKLVPSYDPTTRSRRD